jgi:hypothetical protein
MFQILFARLYRWLFYRTQSRKLLEDIETFYQCKTILLYLYSKEIEMTNSCENETNVLLGDLTKFVNGGQLIVMYGISETYCKRIKRLYKLYNASYRRIFHYMLKMKMKPSIDTINVYLAVLNSDERMRLVKETSKKTPIAWKLLS